ncbi:hypothetical protein DFH05DRAFT_1462183 [Lentinula detonsa]|uniref:Uncharacterized protein n=1 Tax=Lentinula detonsa TaxID=2804962 RepID=A0A9W8NWD8_9AGAR|nr:hypothetical protein DFH05DRAFT_1462183 [Lentinula detonsa]
MDLDSVNLEGPNKKAQNSLEQSAHQTPVITSPTTQKITQGNPRVASSPTRSYRRGHSGALDSKTDTNNVFTRDRYDPARDAENCSIHAVDDWTDQQNLPAPPPPNSTASSSEEMDDEDETTKPFGSGRVLPYHRSGSNTTPTKTTNRVTHTLAGTVLPLILKWPSRESEKANTPHNKDLNPHGPLLSPEQDAKIQIHFQKALVSDGTWESVVFYPSDLLCNLEPEQRKTIVKNPKKWLAIVYLNGGRDLFRKKTSTVIDTESFLNEVGCQVEVVIAPFYETNTPPSPIQKRPRGLRDVRKPAWKPIVEGEGDKYAGGYTVFFKITDPDMRGYLTECQTWAISPVLAFHTLEFDIMEWSWTVCLVYANIDSTSSETGEEILYAIKDALWHDTKFTTLYMNNTSYTGSLQEAVLTFTNTFELLDEAEKAVRTYIAKKEYFVDGAKILQHTTEECPFRKANGWNGPTMGVNQTIEAFSKKSMEEKQLPGPSHHRR